MVVFMSAGEIIRRWGVAITLCFLLLLAMPVAGFSPARADTGAGMILTAITAACRPRIKAADAAPSADSVFTNDLGMTFVYIPPGKFIMGSAENEPGRDNDEKQHKTTLTRGFYIQTTEVTQAQWTAIMGKNPSHFLSCGGNCPVEQVSWNDVQEFIKKLNQTGKRIYRLPTEAEWEYACRAGTTGPFNTGDCLSTDQANYDGKFFQQGCSAGVTRNSLVAVKSFAPNAWGLYDMHGNVWEWCADWSGEYSSFMVVDPVGPSAGQARIFRGGGWSSGARGCRSAERNWRGPDFKSSIIGFRLVVSQ
ncbi:MAG: formylglycine-generating enzyme family protein [Thermodesulfobacteriota bacterium]